MTLKDFGYNSNLEAYRKDNIPEEFKIGRVISEYKERYLVKTEEGEFEAEIIGKLRFGAQTRSDFPIVGDWVAISDNDETNVFIHAIFPRKTTLERQAVGKLGEKQIIAANIDYALIVQAVNRDYNINSIERYLTICNTSGIESIIILTKTDLIDGNRLKDIQNAINQRIGQISLVSISNETREGYEGLLQYIKPEYTYCLLGSSGVGKSTLINNLTGKSIMRTESISQSTNKGKHVTSHRQLVVIENGGILIDNPGIREVGIADAVGGLEITFERIFEIAQQCRFKDCEHIHESGCAVTQAVENGEIDRASYDNYLRMEREKKHFESTVAEKRKKDKDFGKMVKSFKKDRKQNKF